MNPSLAQKPRSEAHLERSLYRTLHELQRLQANHGGQPVPPPAAVDIDVGVGGMDDQKEGLIGLVVLARHMLAPTTHST